jgi:uncharacterized protein
MIRFLEIKSIQFKRSFLDSLNRRLKITLSLLFVFSLISCATYQSEVSSARVAIAKGEIDKALKELKPKADKKSDNQLVYVLDYATALQMSGKIEESNRYFMLADKLAEQMDYHSVTNVASSMLLNEEMVQYKGDTFEKVFINAFLAMNYLKLNNYDDAMVEVRRMNEKFNKYRLDEKKVFEVNPFSRYLAAVIYEATKKWDDAYIAYQETYKLDPTIPTIKEDLIRSSYWARRTDDHAMWKKKFPEVDFKPEARKNKKGEIVLLYLSGWGPRKQPDPSAPLMPILVPVYNQTQKASLVVNGTPYPPSVLVYDTQNAAIATLNADRPALIARRIAARVAREVAARQIADRDKNNGGLLGAVAFIGMQVTERADLRQWSFLPASIQISRISLDAGEYDVAVQGENFGGMPNGERSEPQKIKVSPGQTQFVIWRSVK